MAMASIYSLRPVYTFLYTIINDNVIASFVQKRKVLRFYDQKKFFCTRTQPWNAPPPLYAIGRIWFDPSPPPLCVFTMWMIPTEMDGGYDEGRRWTIREIWFLLKYG